MRLPSSGPRRQLDDIVLAGGVVEWSGRCDCAVVAGAPGGGWGM